MRFTDDEPTRRAWPRDKGGAPALTAEAPRAAPEMGAEAEAAVAAHRAPVESAAEVAAALMSLSEEPAEAMEDPQGAEGAVVEEPPKGAMEEPAMEEQAEETVREMGDAMKPTEVPATPSTDPAELSTAAAVEEEVVVETHAANEARAVNEEEEGNLEGCGVSRTSRGVADGDEPASGGGGGCMPPCVDSLAERASPPPPPHLPARPIDAGEAPDATALALEDEEGRDLTAAAADGSHEESCGGSVAVGGDAATQTTDHALAADVSVAA